MHEVMSYCVIMHNMIVEDERPDGKNENGWDFQGELVAPNPGPETWEEFLNTTIEVTDANISKRLQKDLIDYQWILAGYEENLE